jgi:hypothetical protein
MAAWGAAAFGISALSGRPGALFANLLGTHETPDELRDIYSGKKEVAIRKGRWWEFGRSTAYEGGRIDYYRPHALERLRTRAYQKGIWGTEKETWEHDPILHPFKALFGSDDWKYYYENKYQQERPAPLTGTYGEEIPFIGPLVAATFGKLFKPRKEVRPEEWKTSGGGMVHRPDIRGETEPAYGLGGIGPGAAVRPDDPTQLINELNYRRREAVGLMGFVEGSITKDLLGREEIYPNLTTLGTMGKETGSEYWLWKHLNVGGAAGTSEAVRRFIPRKRSYLETYNPLRNEMPSWLPDDYFLDLKYGNPYEKIPEAEIRLPGTGYAALHPEVAGLESEDYPLAHRVKILGDVAMWSDQYKTALRNAKKNLKNLSEKEQSIVLETERQVKEKKKRRTFKEYRFQEDLLTAQNLTVTGIVSPKRIVTEELGGMAIEIPGIGAIKNKEAAMQFMQESLLGKEVTVYSPSLESRRFIKRSGGPTMLGVPMLEGKDVGSILAERGLVTEKTLTDEFEQLRMSRAERLAGRLSEGLLHGAETPLEYLTPLSPASKLIRQRSAVEEYVASEAIGTGASFWDKPLKNFIVPAINMAKYKAGITDIPEDIQERRDIQEYFDMLKWVKTSRLERKAEMMGDPEVAEEYRKLKESTVFGVDVFKSPVSIMKALPRRERDFFASFTQAKTQEARDQILSLVPENEKRIYQSQWLRQQERAGLIKRQAKMNTEEDGRTIAQAIKMRRSEGFDYKRSMRNQWQEETDGAVEFDEWLREQKAEEYFQTHSLPGASWLGWHPQVDLEDVKMKFVENAALDHHDFDLWGQRKRALARKPYINTQLIDEMATGSEYTDSWNVAKNSKVLTKMFSEGHPEIVQSQLDAEFGKDKYNIEVYDSREKVVKEALKQFGVQ